LHFGFSVRVGRRLKSKREKKSLEVIVGS
jgi:hypothetical protein